MESSGSGSGRLARLGKNDIRKVIQGEIGYTGSLPSMAEHRQVLMTSLGPCAADEWCMIVDVECNDR